jgi:hypothetical protein
MVMEYKNKYDSHYHYSSCSLSLLKGETVSIKFGHLIRTVSSYRKDLYLVRLILISKMNYKIMKLTSTPVFKTFAKSI